MSIMVVSADPAAAHHPEIGAFQTCIDRDVSIHFDAISWKTDGTSGSGHSDIRIEVRVNGSGSWTQVAGGAFADANNYRFSGDFQAAPYWGETVEVRARANGAWDNGIGGGETRTASPFVVTQDCFNPSCPDSYYEHKIEPVPDGSTTHGPNDEFEISANSNSFGEVFDWTSTLPVYRVIVKGGPGANIYDYSPDYSDTGLHAPLNSENKYYGLSHITICYGDPVVEEVKVVVSHGDCVVDDVAIPGGVTVTIDPESGASVQVTGPGGPYDFTGAGGSQTLAPGIYSWTAQAADGYKLVGETSGEFTVEPCTASVQVGHESCSVDDGIAPGGTSVTIDPSSGAKVAVYDDAAKQPGDLVAIFAGGGGSQTLAPGTYYWEATAAEGFVLTGDVNGQFTIEPCESSVVVVSGDCEVDDQGAPVGQVDVGIEIAGSATVNIYNSETDVLVSSFSGTGESDSLAPGDYYWTATPSDDVELDGLTSGEFTIEPCGVAVGITSSTGVCEDYDESPVFEVSVIIDPDNGATVTIYDDANQPAAIVTEDTTLELDPGMYSWTAVGADGFELNGVIDGTIVIEPCEATVLVTGECQIGEDGSSGVINMTLSEGVEKVDIYSGATLVGTATESGTVLVAEGGAYSWFATPTDGFEIQGPAEGVLNIDDCVEQTTVVVSFGNCEDATFPNGYVDVSMNPDGATSVFVFDSESNEVAVIESAGSEPIAPGSYSWAAIAHVGYELVGPSAGSFTVEICPDEVLPEEILPFTGMDAETLAGFGLIFLIAGLYAVGVTRRREEG